MAVLVAVAVIFGQNIVATCLVLAEASGRRALAAGLAAVMWAGSFTTLHLTQAAFARHDRLLAWVMVSGVMCGVAAGTWTGMRVGSRLRAHPLARLERIEKTLDTPP